MWSVIDVVSLWYPLPVVIPDDVKVIIYDYAFDPFGEPWV